MHEGCSPLQVVRLEAGGRHRLYLPNTVRKFVRDEARCGTDEAQAQDTYIVVLTRVRTYFSFDHHAKRVPLREKRLCSPCKPMKQQSTLPYQINDSNLVEFESDL
jgi:hypothetical protein